MLVTHESAAMPQAHDAPPAPWVIVAGGFHDSGAMDRANAALALHLRQRGIPLHLVSYRVDSHIAKDPGVTVHRARRPAGSFLAQWTLERTAWTVAAYVKEKWPRARVVVNGGNCIWPDVNWVHCVHHAWPVCDEQAPLWFKAKNRAFKFEAKRRELCALRDARVVIANSNKTRADLIDHLGLDPARIHTVYPGADAHCVPPTPERCAAARVRLGKSAARPLVAFVGALGHDSNKGFDLLWAAWQRLCARPGWDADLIAAGGGRALPGWRHAIAAAGLGHRVTMLGFTRHVADLLAAADLLVSPVRYEAYGVNVQEAICAGVPALVSASAGIAERYPADLGDLLIAGPGSVDDLAARLLQWRDNIGAFRRRVEPLGRTLRAFTLDAMAREIVAVVESAPLPAPRRRFIGR
ncbi:MAG: glycosyltransferase family 4 protein [Candidatus Binataceae bacterium]